MLKKRLKAGLTMAELLVSLNIICFAILIMAAVLCMLLRSSQKNVDDSSAYIVADSIMKKYIADNRYNLGAAGGKEETIKAGDKTFNCTVTSTVANADTKLYYILVEVDEIVASGGSDKPVNVKVSTLQRELVGGTGGAEK